MATLMESFGLYGPVSFGKRQLYLATALAHITPANARSQFEGAGYKIVSLNSVQGIHSLFEKLNGQALEDPPPFFETLESGGLITEGTRFWVYIDLT